MFFRVLANLRTPIISRLTRMPHRCSGSEEAYWLCKLPVVSKFLAILSEVCEHLCKLTLKEID